MPGAVLAFSDDCGHPRGPKENAFSSWRLHLEAKGEPQFPLVGYMSERAPRLRESLDRSRRDASCCAGPNVAGVSRRPDDKREPEEDRGEYQRGNGANDEATTNGALLCAR